MTKQLILIINLTFFHFHEVKVISCFDGFCSALGMLG